MANPIETIRTSASSVSTLVTRERRFFENFISPKRKKAERQDQEKVDDVSRNGNAVLLAPGFAGPEWSLYLQGLWLKEDGYKPYNLKHGKFRMNLVTGQKDSMKERLKYITDKHEGRAAIVGHSLGGDQAEDVAFENPDLVHTVFRAASPKFCAREKPEEVRIISIVCAKDLLVRPWLSRDPSADETIIVNTGHLGFVTNMEAHYLISERLEMYTNPDLRYKHIDKHIDKRTA